VSNTLPTPPGPVSQAMSNAVYTVMARQRIESARDLGVPEHVRQQVLGLAPMTTEGLATVAEALGVAPSQIVSEAQDAIDRHAHCDHGGDQS